MPRCQHRHLAPPPSDDNKDDDVEDKDTNEDEDNSDEYNILDYDSDGNCKYNIEDYDDLADDEYDNDDKYYIHDVDSDNDDADDIDADESDDEDSDDDDNHSYDNEDDNYDDNDDNKIKLECLHTQLSIVQRLIVVLGPHFQVSYSPSSRPDTCGITTLQECIVLSEIICGLRFVHVPSDGILIFLCSDCRLEGFVFPYN